MANKKRKPLSKEVLGRRRAKKAVKVLMSGPPPKIYKHRKLSLPITLTVCGQSDLAPLRKALDSLEATLKRTFEKHIRAALFDTTREA
jgi:hypothetical protein